MYAAKHAHGSQIVRMLNDVNFAKKKQGGVDAGGVDGVDLCPASLEKEIDGMNEFVYEKVSHAKVLRSSPAVPSTRHARLHVSSLRGRPEHTIDSELQGNAKRPMECFLTAALHRLGRALAS